MGLVWLFGSLTPPRYPGAASTGGDELLFLRFEKIAVRRRFPLYLVADYDGVTPVTGEAGGQPQLSKAGGAWADTSGTLVEVGDGFYYLNLSSSEVDTLGLLSVRYSASGVADFFGTAMVVAESPYEVD